MQQLDPVERVKIIRDSIDLAKVDGRPHLQINWAHLFLAALVEAGYVHRILTTNFDPLAVDALAMLGQPVRTFDLMASQTYEPGLLDPGAIVYLHGQAHGLWLANADNEMQRIRAQLNRVFDDTLRDGLLVVVGYIGDCDPVIQELSAGRRQFGRGLYWVPNRTIDSLGRDARQFLSDPGRHAFVVPDYDADTFMRELTTALELPVPTFVVDPMAAAKIQLQRIMPYPQRKGSPPVKDPVLEAIAAIESVAIVRSETPAGERASTPEPSVSGRMPKSINKRPKLLVTISWLGVTPSANEFDRLYESVVNEQDNSLNVALGDVGLALVSQLLRNDLPDDAMRYLHQIERLGTTNPNWLNELWGRGLAVQARRSKGDDADRLRHNAYLRFERAIEIKPDMVQAWNNWGNTLNEHASEKDGVEADRLWAEAFQRFDRAIEIKPDYAPAWNNWGFALLEQAIHKDAVEGNRLRHIACDKFARAVEIKPEFYEAWVNWGNALADRAERSATDEAVRLLNEACQKYARAIEAKPDNEGAWNNWALVLAKQAKCTHGSNADRLWHEAFEKYTRAADDNPDSFGTWMNWGISLIEYAQLKEGNIADEHLENACQKFSRCVEINSRDVDVWNNWGCALNEQAQQRQGEEADRFWQEAYAKYAEAIQIKPDMYGAWYNWAIALDQQARRKQGEEADQLWQEAYAKYDHAIQLQPRKHEAWNNWGVALDQQARRKQGEESDQLWQEAYAKYARAIKIKADLHLAWSNWGNALSQQAQRKQGEEADRLWQEANTKYDHVIQTEPGNYEVCSNWGAALIQQAQSSSGEKAARLFRDAEKTLDRAVTIAPNYTVARLNLACCMAIQRRVAETIGQLEKWKELEPSATRAKIESDADFAGVLHEPQFQWFLATLQ